MLLSAGIPIVTRAGQLILNPWAWTYPGRCCNFREALPEARAQPKKMLLESSQCCFQAWLWVAPAGGQFGPVAGSHCPLVVTGEHSVAVLSRQHRRGCRRWGRRAERAQSAQLFLYPEWTVYGSGRHPRSFLTSLWVKKAGCTLCGSIYRSLDIWGDRNQERGGRLGRGWEGPGGALWGTWKGSPSPSAPGSMVSSGKDGGRVPGQKQVMGFLMNLKVFSPCILHPVRCTKLKGAPDIFVHMVILGYPSPRSGWFLKIEVRLCPSPALNFMVSSHWIWSKIQTPRK